MFNGWGLMVGFQPTLPVTDIQLTHAGITLLVGRGYGVFQAEIMKIFEKYHPVIRDIKKWFKFLFDQGYIIKYANFKQYQMTFWSIYLESSASIIHIFQDHSEIFLGYAPKNYLIEKENRFYLKDEIALQIMIYHATNGAKFVDKFEDKVYRSRKKQFAILSKLVEEYHEKIIGYFNPVEFRWNEKEIDVSAEKFNRILIDKHVYGK